MITVDLRIDDLPTILHGQSRECLVCGNVWNAEAGTPQSSLFDDSDSFVGYICQGCLKGGREAAVVTLQSRVQAQPRNAVRLNEFIAKIRSIPTGRWEWHFAEYQRHEELNRQIPNMMSGKSPK